MGRHRLDRLLTSVALVVSLTALGAPPALGSSPAITLSPSAAPPGSVIAVGGSSFGANEAVDIYFDTTDEVLAATDDTGAFSKSITIPPNASYETHWITAVGRHSGLAAQQAFLVSANWPQFRRTQLQDGFNPHESALSPGTVGAVGLDWSFVTGDYVHSSPAVANGVLYVGSDDGHLYALNPATGALDWSQTLDQYVFSSPAVANGIVYAVGATGSAGSRERLRTERVHGRDRLDLRDIQQLRFPDGRKRSALHRIRRRPFCPERLHRRTPMVPRVSGALRCRILPGGGQRGRLRRGQQSCLRLECHYWRGPEDLRSERRVLLHTNSGERRSLRRVRRRRLRPQGFQRSGPWSHATGIMDSGPAIANGVVYVGSLDHKVYALKASTGAQLWSHATGAYDESSPAVANGVVYVGSLDHKVYALKASTGAALWSYTTGDKIIRRRRWRTGSSTSGPTTAACMRLAFLAGCLRWHNHESRSFGQPLGGLIRASG